MGNGKWEERLASQSGVLSPQSSVLSPKLPSLKSKPHARDQTYELELGAVTSE